MKNDFKLCTSEVTLIGYDDTRMDVEGIMLPIIQDWQAFQEGSLLLSLSRLGLGHGEDVLKRVTRLSQNGLGVIRSKFILDMESTYSIELCNCVMNKKEMISEILIK